MIPEDPKGDKVLNRFIWGFLLVGLGVLFLLQTFGYPIALSFWSVIALGAGISIIYGSLGRRRSPSWFGLLLGAWVGAIGLFDILSRSGISLITGGDIARAGWPLLLIGIGLSVLLGRSRILVFSGNGDRKTKESTQLVGDMNYGGDGPWVLDDDLNLHTSVGDLRVDLVMADITPGAHHITISQLVGETVVRVPDNVTVRASAEVSAGEVDVLGESRSGVGFVSVVQEVVVPGSHAQLIIEASMRVGSIRITRVPAPTFRVS